MPAKTDFHVHPFGVVICAQMLDDYRFGKARVVSLHEMGAPALPMGAFDRPAKRQLPIDPAQNCTGHC